MKFFKNYFIYIFVFLILGCGTISLEYSAEIKDPEEVTIEFEFIATDLATSVFVDDINEDFKFSSNNPIPISPVSEFLKDWDVEIINEDFSKVRYVAKKTFKGSEAKEFLNPKYQDDSALDVFPRFLMTESHERGETIYKFSMIPSWFGEKSWEDSFADRGFSEDEVNSLRFNLEEMGGIVTFDIKLKVFGEIVDSNADKQEGNQLIWRFDFERIFETREKEVPYVITKEKKGFVSSLFGSCNMPDDTEIEKLELISKNISIPTLASTPTPTPKPSTTSTVDMTSTATPTTVPTISPTSTAIPTPYPSQRPTEKQIYDSKSETRDKFFGIFFMPVTESDYFMILGIMNNSSAHRKGLRPSDKIFEINGVKIKDIYSKSNYDIEESRKRLNNSTNENDELELLVERLGMISLERTLVNSENRIYTKKEEIFVMMANGLMSESYLVTLGNDELEPVRRISIEEFQEEYDQNEIVAKNKYHGNQVILKGIIKGFETETYFHELPTKITITSSNIENFFMEDVYCFVIEETNPKGINHLKKGDEVYLLGYFDFEIYYEYPSLLECGDMTEEVHNFQNYKEEIEKSRGIIKESPSDLLIYPTSTPIPTPTPTPTPDVSNIELIPDITIISEEIINEFNLDRLNAFEKYKNKIIKFEYSTVNSMFISDQITDKFIEFGSGKSTDRLNFRCPIIELTEELKDIIVSNQVLTITGKLNEINEITGFLNPCKIYVPPKILPTPTPIPTWIDAKTLIDQFIENSNYYSQFYENKHLEIFGTVFDYGQNMRGLPYLEFGSNRVIERIKIKCDTVSKSNTSYTDNSEIIARGTFTKFHGNRIILDECEINSK